jgi:hypothetical protein
MSRLNTVHLESALAQQETELASSVTSHRNGSVTETTLQINAKSIFKPNRETVNKIQTIPISVSRLADKVSTNSMLETEGPKSSLREQPNQFEVTIESLQSLLNFYKDQQVDDV